MKRLRPAPFPASIGDVHGYYEAQLRYYESHRDTNRRAFRIFYLVGTLAAVAVPVLVAAGVGPRWVDALLSAIALLTVSISALFGWQTDYPHFTRVAIELKGERLLFENDAGPYLPNPEAGVDKNQLFADRLVAIVKGEIDRWKPPEPKQPG